ncbi:MAG: energy transducer TonB [Burkholderiaceae bacterium]
MMSGTTPPSSTLVALLGTIALHLALIASATGWLAPFDSWSKPAQNAPTLIVALHSAVPVTAVVVSAPTAASQASGNARPPPSPPVMQQKPQSRRPAATHEPALHKPNTPPAAPPSQPITPITTPSAIPSQAAESALAAAADVPSTASSTASTNASPSAANTGVTIPASYAARNRKPNYPLMSRRYNEQGTAVLRVLVNADGTAGEVHIRKSSTYPLLDQSALAAVRDWRFVAATRDGKSVSEWYEISIPYTLQD